MFPSPKERPREGRDLVRHRLPVVLRRQAPVRGGARAVRAPRPGRGAVAQLRARPRRRLRGDRRGVGVRRPAGPQVRHEPPAVPADAGLDDGHRGRRGPRLPLRAGGRGQHLRRPPGAPPRRGARAPGRDEGAAAARLLHRGPPGRRPGHAGAPRRRGRPRRGRGPPGRSRARHTPPRSGPTRRRPAASASAACRSSSSTAPTASPAPSRPSSCCRSSSGPGRRADPLTMVGGADDTACGPDGCAV